MLVRSWLEKNYKMILFLGSLIINRLSHWDTKEFHTAINLESGKFMIHNHTQSSQEIRAFLNTRHLLFSIRQEQEELISK